MNEILHANIFFLIASIATICFCILVCILLYQIIKIAKKIRAIVDRIEAGSEIIAEDAEKIRNLFLDGGFFSRLISLFTGQFTPKTRRRKSRLSEDDDLD